LKAQTISCFGIERKLRLDFTKVIPGKINGKLPYPSGKSAPVLCLEALEPLAVFVDNKSNKTLEYIVNVVKVRFKTLYP